MDFINLEQNCESISFHMLGIRLDHDVWAVLSDKYGNPDKYCEKKMYLVHQTVNLKKLSKFIELLDNEDSLTCE